MQDRELEIKNFAGDVSFEVFQMEHLESSEKNVYALTYDQGNFFTIMCCKP